jgi:hypothetical protein
MVWISSGDMEASTCRLCALVMRSFFALWNLWPVLLLNPTLLTEHGEKEAHVSRYYNDFDSWVA